MNAKNPGMLVTSGVLLFLPGYRAEISKCKNFGNETEGFYLNILSVNSSCFIAGIKKPAEAGLYITLTSMGIK